VWGVVPQKREAVQKSAPGHLNMTSLRCGRLFHIRPETRDMGSTECTVLQVKVWLGDGESMDHYYVLSRFLISRMLTLAKIPYIKVRC
jgi:hypothetical protein